VVFELLTGKHPFDKQSAEVAFKEGRKPPKVPGLTKRQYKTLCDAVAFTSDRRLKSAEQLVQGLREIGWRERVGRPLLYAALLTLALVGAGWAVMNQLHARQVAQVAARFEPASPQHYADEAQAVAALASLDDNERKQLILEQGDLVQRFLIGRVDAYWDPARGRRDYASARHVFDLLGRLHLFLPQLELKRVAMEKEKYDLDHPRPVATEVGAHPESEPASAGTAGLAAAAAAQKAADAAAEKAAAEQAAARAQAERMQKAVAGILSDGERNYSQQKYSAAIANARAALQINPDDPGAKRLLKRAQQAQQRAMSNITIN
ncbi:MAG TPA: protein kinase, partial [Rhodanobacteraceae bacterium]|nr:protein kinase [Rhodanobacteraceae bacterium]